jgi:hypothetical protein
LSSWESQLACHPAGAMVVVLRLACLAQLYLPLVRPPYHPAVAAAEGLPAAAMAAAQLLVCLALLYLQRILLAYHPAVAGVVAPPLVCLALLHAMVLPISWLASQPLDKILASQRSVLAPLGHSVSLLVRPWLALSAKKILRQTVVVLRAPWGLPWTPALPRDELPARRVEVGDEVAQQVPEGT